MAIKDQRDDFAVITEAFAAIREDVLPGLGIAWDRAGPATLFVAEFIIADLIKAEGYSPDALLDGLKAYLAAAPELKQA
jgi:hypothetical protein